MVCSLPVEAASTSSSFWAVLLASRSLSSRELFSWLMRFSDWTYTSSDSCSCNWTQTEYKSKQFVVWWPHLFTGRSFSMGRNPKHLNWSLGLLRDQFLDLSSSPHTLHHWDPSYRHMVSPTIAMLMTHSSRWMLHIECGWWDIPLTM